ncbi:MAG: hypothetical protein AAF290_09085 [Pseudomonadota bacterium]
MKIADLRDRAAVIEYAAHVGDFRQLTQISDLLVEQTARGNLQKLVHYYSALAAYRAAEIDADVEYRVGVLLDRCVDQGKAALKLDPEFAEALALIGACHGLAAARQPLAAIVSGNFSARELKRALALAPENPRVQLLHAITLMRRYESPQRRAQAEESLGEALRLFDAFATMDDAESPQWGQEHAHLWMARLALANDDKVAARDHLEQALLIAPDFEMARVEFTSLGS